MKKIVIGFYLVDVPCRNTQTAREQYMLRHIIFLKMNQSVILMTTSAFEESKPFYYIYECTYKSRDGTGNSALP